MEVRANWYCFFNTFQNGIFYFLGCSFFSYPDVWFIRQQEEKAEKENLEAQLDILDKFEKNYKDPGPVVDCVVFHDGNAFQWVLFN